MLFERLRSFSRRQMSLIKLSFTLYFFISCRFIIFCVIIVSADTVAELSYMFLVKKGVYCSTICLFIKNEFNCYLDFCNSFCFKVSFVYKNFDNFFFFGFINSGVFVWNTLFLGDVRISSIILVDIIKFYFLSLWSSEKKLFKNFGCNWAVGETTTFPFELLLFVYLF